MKNNDTKVLFIAAPILAIAVGLLVFIFTSGGGNNQPADNGTSTSTANEQGGIFTRLTDTALAETADKRQVLFFHAVWCVVCNQIERNINAGVLPEDVAVIIVDLDEHRDLVKKHEVRLQTHFVQIDNDGNKIKEWNWLGNPNAGADDIEAELI